MTVYIVGVTALTGGGEGALDSVLANGIGDGYPALVTVQGGEVYFFIADADSGAAESSPDVIKPDWLSAGVPYTGDLRWIRHDVNGAGSMTGAQIKVAYEGESDTNAYTDAEKSKLSGIEASADVTDSVNIGTSINGASAKTTPVNADQVGLIDSEDSNLLKKLTWTNIKATLKTYFDTLYNNYTLENHASNHTDGTDDIQNATDSQKGLATAAQITKLDGIEAGATGDQTQADLGVYAGSGTFAGASGTVITIGVTLTGTTYRVAITPTADSLNVGAIYVTTKTTTTFKVHCTGGGTPGFDWILIDKN